MSLALQWFGTWALNCKLYFLITRPLCSEPSHLSRIFSRTTDELWTRWELSLFFWQSFWKHLCISPERVAEGLGRFEIRKKIRKENYKRLPRSIEPSRFQNSLATESHKTLFSHASNTWLEFSSFFSHIVILIADPVCYSRWHKRCSRDRLKMQMTHFFFHDHDATQSECAHRLGGSVVFIRVFETGNYRKLTTNEGGSLEYYRALRDQVSFVVAKSKSTDSSHNPPPPAFRDKWWLVPWDVSKCKWAKKRNKFCTCYRAFHDTQSDDSKHQNYKALHF